MLYPLEIIAWQIVEIEDYSLSYLLLQLYLDEYLATSIFLIQNPTPNPSGFTSLNPPMKEVNIDGIKMQMPTEIPSVDGKQNKSDPVIDMLFNISNKNNNENGSSVNK
mgnify:CR=1 FL=1